MYVVCGCLTGWIHLGILNQMLSTNSAILLHLTALWDIRYLPLSRFDSLDQVIHYVWLPCLWEFSSPVPQDWWNLIVWDNPEMLHPLPCGFNYQTADQLNSGPWKKVWRPEMWHWVWLYILYSSRISMPTMHALRKWWSSMDRFTQSFDFWCVWNTPPNPVFGIFYVKVHIFFLFKIGPMSCMAQHVSIWNKQSLPKHN